MDLITHLESHLGQISKGWDLKIGNKDIQVVKCDNHPKFGVSTFSTLGLSSYDLNMPDERTIKQEFFVSSYDKYNDEKLASFLLTFASGILSSGRAILRGECIGSGSLVIEDSTLNGVYCSNPVFQNDSFSVFKGEHNVVMVWLIPVHSQEVKFIRQNGWNKFEDGLENEYCDFWDLGRQPMTFVSSSTKSV